MFIHLFQQSFGDPALYVCHQFWVYHVVSFCRFTPPLSVMATLWDLILVRLLWRNCHNPLNVITGYLPKCFPALGDR